MIELIKANTKFFFITWGIVLLANQIFIFGGCFAPYCIIAALPHTGIISAVIVYLNYEERRMSQDGSDYDTLHDKIRKEISAKKEHPRESQEESDWDIIRETAILKEEYRRLLEDEEEQYGDKKKTDPLKEMGDAYEKRIGKEFESKGDFVIYNGLIRDRDDRGVDLIVISPESQSINLVQCKNWQRMKMEHQHIKKVYDKLTDYESDLDITEEFDFHLIRHSSIQKHLHYKKETNEIDRILRESKNYTNIRKTLYIATDQVVDLNIGEHLTMLSPNIFRYKDMKIAIVRNIR